MRTIHEVSNSSFHHVMLQRCNVHNISYGIHKDYKKQFLIILFLKTLGYVPLLALVLCIVHQSCLFVLSFFFFLLQQIISTNERWLLHQQKPFLRSALVKVTTFALIRVINSTAGLRRPLTTTKHSWEQLPNMYY